MTPAELAAKTNVAERYAREWLSHQAASGYLEYDPATGKFTLTPEQAMVFAEPTVPSISQPRSIWWRHAGQPARGRAGVPYRQWRRAGARVSGCLFCAIGRSSGWATTTASSALWLPALDGVLRSSSSARASPTLAAAPVSRRCMMAKAYPQIELVRRLRLSPAARSSRRGPTPWQHRATADRVRVATASAKDLGETDLDLVTMFDCLHDMGDPRGVRAHVREILKPDGTLDDRRAAAADRAEDNVQPGEPDVLQRSTMICVPTSLDQPVGAALGAQAGDASARRRSKRGRIRATCGKATADAVQHGARGASLSALALLTPSTSRRSAGLREGVTGRPERASLPRPKRRSGRG